ncbi:MAG: DedA family protein [bacterium]|nr:DedA family protein [bacterium]
MHLFASIVDSIQIQFPLLAQYKYLFLLIATAIEGFNSIILAGFLVSLGTVAFIPAVIICVVGDFLNGWAWYAVGYFGGAKPIDKWGRKDPKSRKIIETVERYFKRYSGRAIIFTKLTWSLTIATMIMAGSFKYDFRKFSYYNFIGGLGWVALTFAIGFLFGKGYRAVNIVNNIGYIVLFLFLAILLVYILKVIFKSKFIQSLTAMEHLRDLSEKLKDNIDKLMS